MIAKYIEVSATWVNENIEQYPSINSAQHNNGKWFTSANARVEFPELFTGNEPIVELDNEIDFKTVNEE
jgi:hypothetical protein